LEERVVEEEIRERERENNFSNGVRLNYRRVKRHAKAILDVVSSTLNKSEDLLHQEAVLQVVWSDGLAAVVLPESHRLAVEN